MGEKNTINTNKTIVLELNYCCNLKCVHCYVPDVDKKDSPFLSLKDAKRIFDEMELNGFDRVLFTGGEPLANPQFLDIYQEAWNRGFIISIFTNATLIGEKEKKLLIDKQPDLLRISLFGGSIESYKEVTKADYFDMVLENIKFFYANNINVQVKIPLLRQNGQDVKSIHKKLKEMGVTNKIEIRIIPRFNGDVEALKYRYTPQEIIDMKLDDEKKSLDFYKKIRINKGKKVKNLKYCVEHCQPFVINPEMKLQLCYFIRDWEEDLNELNLKDAILKLSEKILKENITWSESMCEKCDKQYMCPYCPGWARNEIDCANDKIPFLCQLVELYEHKYSSILEKEKEDD